MLMNSLNVVLKSKLPNIILEYHNIHAFMYWSTLVSFSLSFCKALQFEIETSMILQFDNLTIYYHSAKLTVLELNVFEK